MRTEQFRFIRGCSDVNVAGWSVATRRAGVARTRGENSCKPPETSGWLWQFKSCERGGGVATPGDLIAPRILAAARLESPRARAPVLFPVNSRPEAAVLPLRGGRGKKRKRWRLVWERSSSSSSPLSAAEDEIRLRGEWDGAPRRAGCGNWLPVLPEQPQTERYHRNFLFLEKNILHFRSARGPQVIPFKPVKFFHSNSNDSCQICIQRWLVFWTAMASCFLFQI